MDMWKRETDVVLFELRTASEQMAKINIVKQDWQEFFVPSTMFFNNSFFFVFCQVKDKRTHDTQNSILFLKENETGLLFQMTTFFLFTQRTK